MLKTRITSRVMFWENMERPLFSTPIDKFFHLSVNLAGNHYMPLAWFRRAIDFLLFSSLLQAKIYIIKDHFTWAEHLELDVTRMNKKVNWDAKKWACFIEGRVRWTFKSTKTRLVLHELMSTGNWKIKPRRASGVFNSFSPRTMHRL